MQSHVFTDFYQFRESNLQLEGQFLIYGKHDDFQWRTDALSLDGSQLLRSQCETGIICEGQSSKAFYQFYFPIGETWSNHGDEFDTGDVLILEPGCEYYEANKSPHDGWHAYMIPIDQVELPDNYHFASIPYKVRIGKQQGARLQQLYQQFFTAIEECPEIENSPAAYMMKGEIDSILMPLVANKQLVEQKFGRNRLSKHKVMTKVQDFIQQSGNTPIHVTQLAEAAHTSDRTLLKVFQDYYGIGPRQYLLLRQLHQLYMDLYIANPAKTNVTEIMIRNGIWEFGRFSGRYKKQFGELPKQTLARVPDRYLPHIIAKIQPRLPVALKRYDI